MPEENPSRDEQDKLAKILERLDYMEFALREQIGRIYAIERKLGLTVAPPPQPVIATPEEPAPEPAIIEPEIIAEEISEEIPELIPEPVEEKPPEEYAPAAPKRDLEALIGGTWFNRIGIAAIILGVGYFLREAFRRGWIGPQGRVAIGVMIGLGLLWAGDRFRGRGYRSYAHGISGGGIAILYLSFFAAFARYELISQGPAFVLMTLVTATAVLLAARYDALAIGILGLIGGFLTPVLLSTGKDNQIGLFSYIALIDAGVLALAYFKQWRVLNYLAFIATVLLSGSWMEVWYRPEKLWTTIFFFTLLFIIFAVLAILHNVINHRPTRPLDLALIFANASVYFGVSYYLLERDYHSYLGMFALILSGFYLGFGYLTYHRDREDKYLILTFLGLASIFLTLAVPIQLDQHWVTMGWAIEGAVLTWVGIRAQNRTTRYGGLAVLAIGFLHWLMVDLGEFSYLTGQDFVPLLNRRGFSAIVLIASLVLVSRLHNRASESLGPDERKIPFELCLAVAHLTALIWLTNDIWDFFVGYRERSLRQAELEPLPWTDKHATIWGRTSNLSNLAQVSLWSIYGSALVYSGLRLRSNLQRAGGLFLFLLAGGLIIIDAGYYAASWHTLIINPTFGAFAVFIAALIGGAYFYNSMAGGSKVEREAVMPTLVAVANLYLLGGLCLEAAGFFNRRIALSDPASHGYLKDTSHFTLTVLLTLYGAIALFFGMRRKSRWLRLGSLGLMVLAALKLIFADIQNFAAPWHLPVLNQTFGGFLIVIAALGFAFRSYSRADETEGWEKRIIVPGLLIVINLLAIIGLSAETYGRIETQMRSDSMLLEELRELRLAKQLSLSVIWAVYGGGMLVAGIWRKYRILRVMGLGLLALTIGKVFLLDLASLDKIYRIVSFVVLGVILLAVSFLYQQWQRRTLEENS